MLPIRNPLLIKHLQKNQSATEIVTPVVVKETSEIVELDRAAEKIEPAYSPAPISVPSSEKPTVVLPNPGPKLKKAEAPENLLELLNTYRACITELKSVINDYDKGTPIRYDWEVKEELLRMIETKYGL